MRSEERGVREREWCVVWEVWEDTQRIFESALPHLPPLPCLPCPLTPHSSLLAPSSALLTRANRSLNLG
ncbi:MAG: hypothetical protein CLLPBCKN_004398 [Chroococcidiopsis cubana SAG 39.79]|jgi:hypothetical protein|nr:hypothetical protein [Chroococcidiopsis cubana SAG 39.79]